jgi:hypothetical protein
VTRYSRFFWAKTSFFFFLLKDCYLIFKIISRWSLRSDILYIQTWDRVTYSYIITQIEQFSLEREYFLFPKVTHSCIASWPGIPYHQFRTTCNNPFPQVHATTRNSVFGVAFNYNSQHPIPDHSCLFRNSKFVLDG